MFRGPRAQLRGRGHCQRIGGREYRHGDQFEGGRPDCEGPGDPRRRPSPPQPRCAVARGLSAHHRECRVGNLAPPGGPASIRAARKGPLERDREQRRQGPTRIIIAAPFPAPGDELAETVATLLEQLGENPDREGLLETPTTVAASLLYLTAGYAAAPASIVGDAIFALNGYYDMVIVKD